MTDETARRAAVQIGALELDGTDTGRAYAPRRLSEQQVSRFVEVAEASGLVVRCCRCGCSHPVVLDLMSAEGDILDDRCVPSLESWAALNSELALLSVRS